MADGAVPARLRGLLRARALDADGSARRDGDALVLANAEGRTLHVPLAHCDGVRVRDDDIACFVAGGDAVELAPAGVAAALAARGAAHLGRAVAFPEVTRALRAY
ncbi:hypothetical protein, partial [Roseisolibacter sp. H3M3-2]|uniref:hypothetical protein n=1 Tax=Roseisolibacter sp. H3M3-2 TaxID=3031323 RepID=UPI0023DC82BD